MIRIVDIGSRRWRGIVVGVSVFTDLDGVGGTAGAAWLSEVFTFAPIPGVFTALRLVRLHWEDQVSGQT
jgi:hypothetical protein